MRIKLILFFVSLIGTVLNAQDDPSNWMHSDGTLEGFAAGAQYYTFVTDANLREQPNTQAKVLAKLPIATQVTVEAIANDSLELRGIKMPWLKVSCKPGGGAKVTGYVWGGFMALASIQTPDEEYMTNRGVLYLTGVSAYNADKHEIAVQVRAALQGKELSKVEFTTAGDPSYYPSFDVRFEPFKNASVVLMVNYYYPACGYPSGNNILFMLGNNQLVKVLETSSISDGGVFYASEEALLPTDRGGIGDHVVVVKDHSEFEEKGDDLVRTKQTYGIVLYKWTGTKLVKAKEMK
ncbi:MAG: hypothetical protein JNJ57_16320 [Saprospiraceae bacterium]|nr:hypothetical protein [Saprospiraceae bacterium]